MAWVTRSWYAVAWGSQVSSSPSESSFSVCPPRQVLFGTGSGAVQVASQFGGAGGAGLRASELL